MGKLFNYWEKNKAFKPHSTKDKVGFYVLDKCMGWHYSYVLGHRNLKSGLLTYKNAWKDSKRNHGATLKELHRYIAKYGELHDD